MQLQRKYVSEMWISKEIEYDDYLHDIPAVKYLKNNRLKFNRNITFFVGENGMGKSTLIEALAVSLRLNPEGGNRTFRFETENTHSELGYCITTSKEDFPKDYFFMRADGFYNFATEFGGGKRFEDFHEMSHGEGFLSMIHKGFFGNGLYILDEPESALSPQNILRLLCEIKRLENMESQMIIATHSPILMAYPGAEIYYFTDAGINIVDYRQTEHFIITKAFLECPERMLNYMLE